MSIFAAFMLEDGPRSIANSGGDSHRIPSGTSSGLKKSTAYVRPSVEGPNIKVDKLLSGFLLPPTMTILFHEKLENLQRPHILFKGVSNSCLLYTSPSPRDKRQSRMPSSA